MKARIMIALVAGVFFYCQYLLHSTEHKEQETKVEILFSCYKVHGTKCNVTSNKNQPCSYTIMICETPSNEVIYRGEPVHEYRRSKYSF